MPITSSRIARQILSLTPHNGHIPSGLDGVTLMRANATVAPTPVLQEPTIVIMGQGLKRGYLGDEVFHYQPGQYLIVAVPMHFNCDTVVCGDGPMLALAVRVDMSTISELLSKMNLSTMPGIDAPKRGMVVADLDDAMNDTVYRLLQALASPDEVRVLGPQLVRELHYRVLQGAGGECLRALLAWHGRYGSIYRACEHIRVNYSQDLDIATLAREAAMSPSVFHQSFKTVTGNSPIQYLKAIRLHRARELILYAGKGVAQAAYAVGYVSASQFSREFKRLFAYSPTEATCHIGEHAAVHLLSPG
ncbi:AraC family transcriptional regulator [Iodobacter ciconiae]|uniref:AraC family transcriptional regulator n=1 Tax=Iodobacter ciconiae TaxID=2496266 RepID=A0A3S8ZNU9_9NEIS|nr:AraC family transcriptional regulator [Iodobacter ciconiae]AZN35062.1 AraC family transcriptional regulator [Iodobacter ciconiae]